MNDKQIEGQEAWTILSLHDELVLAEPPSLAALTAVLRAAIASWDESPDECSQ